MTQRQPVTFYIMCACQFWWAISFYGLWAVLPVFLKDVLQMDEKLSFGIFGGFTAMGASLLFVGGWLSDKVLGARRTLAWGYGFQGIGYVLIAWATISHNVPLIFVGLAVNIVGRSTSGVSTAALIAAAYKPNDPRLDSAFTLFYMVNNIGAFLTQIIAPEISARIGWQAAFILSAFGMAVNLLIIACYHRRLVNASAADASVPSMRTNTLFLAGALAVIALAMFLLRELLITRVLLLCVALAILYLLLRIMRREDKVARIKMVVGAGTDRPGVAVLHSLQSDADIA